MFPQQNTKNWRLLRSIANSPVLKHMCILDHCLFCTYMYHFIVSYFYYRVAAQVSALPFTPSLMQCCRLPQLIASQLSLTAKANANQSHGCLKQDKGWLHYLLHVSAIDFFYSLLFRWKSERRLLVIILLIIQCTSLELLSYCRKRIQTIHMTVC